MIQSSQLIRNIRILPVFGVFLFVVMPVMAGENCESGYTKSATIQITTFARPENNSCASGYTLIQKPDSLYGMYDGFVVGTETRLCTNGYANNNTCTTYSRGGCNENYVSVSPVITTMAAPVNNTCTDAAYTLTAIPNTMYGIFNGFVMGNETRLCTNGYSTNGSSCTAYTRGVCPADYLNMNLNANTFVEQTNNACDTTSYTATIQPLCYVGDDDTCLYIPVDVTLNWYDRNESVATSTCTLGSTIELPPPPTRTGYVFTGWTVQQNEN